MIAAKLDAMHPLCAVCNKPVDSLVWYNDRFKGVRHYIAKCHGDTETTDIYASDLAAMESLDAISAGTAFRPIDRAKLTLEAAGHAVVEQDIPGLYRIDGGPEITTRQLIGIADSQKHQ